MFDFRYRSLKWNITFKTTKWHHQFSPQALFSKKIITNWLLVFTPLPRHSPGTRTTPLCVTLTSLHLPQIDINHVRQESSATISNSEKTINEIFHDDRQVDGTVPRSDLVTPAPRHLNVRTQSSKCPLRSCRDYQQRLGSSLEKEHNTGSGYDESRSDPSRNGTGTGTETLPKRDDLVWGFSLKMLQHCGVSWNCHFVLWHSVRFGSSKFTTGTFGIVYYISLDELVLFQQTWSSIWNKKPWTYCLGWVKVALYRFKQVWQVQKTFSWYISSG